MRTGDLVQLKSSGDRWVVCCVHEPIVFLNKPGDPTARMDDVTLVAEATAEQWMELLKALAASSSNGHRAACAREHLKRIHDLVDGASALKNDLNDNARMTARRGL